MSEAPTVTRYPCDGWHMCASCKKPCGELKTLKDWVDRVNWEELMAAMGVAVLPPYDAVITTMSEDRITVRVHRGMVAGVLEVEDAGDAFTLRSDYLVYVCHER